jgi:putative intracellular protease/amidase
LKIGVVYRRLKSAILNLQAGTQSLKEWVLMRAWSQYGQAAPKYDFADCPSVDLLVVPGGWGTRKLLDVEETPSWIKKVTARAARVTSVSTGSLLLAKAGLLREKEATTH